MYNPFNFDKNLSPENSIQDNCSQLNDDASSIYSEEDYASRKPRKRKQIVNLDPVYSGNLSSPPDPKMGKKFREGNSTPVNKTSMDISVSVKTNNIPLKIPQKYTKDNQGFFTS
ncbi:hypothetical protein PUN28_019730 [Cardiocondyla obscurior]|uniref:Uncharacterized protein n=1 Tax=Cardiocondyla obscurior TaxID=286306 RepID=A0AAW2EG08_9HYME